MSSGSAATRVTSAKVAVPFCRMPIIGELVDVSLVFGRFLQKTIIVQVIGSAIKANRQPAIPTPSDIIVGRCCPSSPSVGIVEPKAVRKQPTEIMDANSVSQVLQE